MGAGPDRGGPTLTGLRSLGDETGDPVLCHNNLSPGNVRTGAGGQLIATGEEEIRFTDRNVRHLLTHLPTRETFEQILDAVRLGHV